jgi:hypothetical protein
MARILPDSLLALCATVFLGLTTVSHAALIDKGGGLIYDTDLDLTWLSDANAAAGSAFDDGTNTGDGGMSWASAVAWADSLTAGGGTNWRLPTTADPDAACSDTDDPTGFSCTGSEMGHLFYVELGGDPNSTIFTSGDPTLLALFSNIQANTYWSGTTEAGFADYAWTFTFSLGAQSDAFKTTNFLQAWAVHDGDVSAVPAPGAVWLLGTGLIAVILKTRRRIRGRGAYDPQTPA